MKQAIFDILQSHLPEILSAAGTAALAWLKRKWDIHNLKKNPEQIHKMK